MERLLVVGCGSIGRRIVPLAQERGIDVCTLNRGSEGFPGACHISADLGDAATLATLPTKGAGIIYLAPPPGGGHLETRVRTFCASIPPGREPVKVVYLSTSAVYGDCGGATVTEECPTNPNSPRGKRRLDGERTFQAWGRERGVEVVILRVSAIYAPDRLPITQLTTGQPVLREEDALPTNRIHADDLAQICLAALERGKDGDVFNVSDGSPTTITGYFNAAADYLGLPRPVQVGWEEARRVMSPLMISYFSESRILDNSRMLRDLGITLRYPDLEAGLKGEGGKGVSG